MVTWFLAFLGIIISFLVKYANRKDKTTKLDIRFWIKDNWAELLAPVLMVIGLIILVNRTEFDTDVILEKYKWLKAIPITEIFAFVIGYLNNVAFYALIRKVKGK